MRALSRDQVRAVKDLQSMWPDRQMVLVGAAALQRFLEMRQRETRDIDLSISIALEDYPGPLVGRPRWSPRRGHAHRWDFDGTVEVDILPAGPHLLAAGKIIWPDGAEMNLTGFRLAFAQSVKVEVAPGLSQDLVRRFLAKANDEDDPQQMQQHMIAAGPPHWGRQPTELLTRLEVFARGLGDGSSGGGASL